MKSITESELHSMFYLLDDSDVRVVDEITLKLQVLGPEISDHINTYLEFCENIIIAERLAKIQANISKQQWINDFINWRNSERQDLLDGLFLVDQLINPEFNRNEILETINRIKLDVWLSLNNQMTSFEIVREFNYVILEKHQFSGDTADYFDIRNSSLSKVLQKKTGNHVLLSCIYLIVAQKLNIPIVGVNLPQQFVLGYSKSQEWEVTEKLNPDSQIFIHPNSDVLFYFNPYNKGIVFMVESVKDFLTQLKIPHQDYFFKSCDYNTIIFRILKNMVNAYLKKGKEEKAQYIRSIIEQVENI